MKNLKNILFIGLCYSLVLTSCEPKQEVNYTIVSGVLENVNGGEVKLSSMFTSISFDSVPAIKKVLKVDEKGAFVDTLYITSSREFSIGKERGYARFVVKPGQHIQFTANSDDFNNSIQFEGIGAEENTYLIKKEQIKERRSIEERNKKYGDEVTFIKKENEEEQAYLSLLNSFNGLSAEFIENEKKDLFYNKVMAYVYYPEMFERTNDGKKAEISEGFFDIVSEVNFEDFSEFQRSTVYQFMLRSYFSDAFAHSVDDVWKADPIKKLELIKEKISNQNILDELCIMFAKYDITRSHNLQEYYDYFMANVSNKTYKEAITSQYKDLVATQPGQPSPEFVDYRNVDGTTTSLTDFRGKYVYIDVWATWCGPCKAEIPFLKEVEKKYHGNENIVFVSLSVDTDKAFQKWKKFVKDEELTGVQIIADKDFDSEFVQKYQIKGIPQFILIDPEGKIVQPSAPRPSNPELIKLFQELGI